MIDAHCHLDDPRFAHDLEAVLQRARDVGVTGYVLAGVSPAGWTAQEALCAAHPEMALTLGIHPWIAAHASAEEARAMLDSLRARLSDGTRGRGSSLRPVAVGEIGLHRGGDTADDTLVQQEALFSAQLALAAEYELPVVLHVLRAHQRALQLLRAQPPLRHGGLVHSYSGAPELVRSYVALGLSFSFTGPVTYANARRPLEAVRAVPPERLLLETDSPDQAPESVRARTVQGAAAAQGRAVGLRNEPAFLVHIAQAIADARSVPLEALQRATTENTRRLFRIS